MGIVSAIIPTRGNVPMEPVIESLPLDWEIVIWNNGAHVVDIYAPGERAFGVFEDIERFNFMGYGRHAGIPFARGNVIYTQDDDVIVHDPEAIFLEWFNSCPAVTINGLHSSRVEVPYNGVIANMPPKFRPHYDDSAMLGFGACYERNLPPAVLSGFLEKSGMSDRDPLFLREADRALTVLAPFKLVDVSKEDREFAGDEDRLWRQPDHVHHREEMLAIARKVRDGS